ncbi:hypothetical protein AGLY_008904 [Aphis glycines]|uniref:Uncharacterized protein n=1 Tax=Aphis glycines TaxID=307491 RepID=A0A6G0TKB3_APHGL|nr:hypothetical protein AGLY_008904 [Aphis glycines]
MKTYCTSLYKIKEKAKWQRIIENINIRHIINRSTSTIKRGCVTIVSGMKIRFKSFGISRILSQAYSLLKSYEIIHPPTHSDMKQLLQIILYTANRFMILFYHERHPRTKKNHNNSMIVSNGNSINNISTDKRVIRQIVYKLVLTKLKYYNALKKIASLAALFRFSQQSVTPTPSFDPPAGSNRQLNVRDSPASGTQHRSLWLLPAKLKLKAQENPNR